MRIKSKIQKGEPVLDGVPQEYKDQLKVKYDRALSGESFDYLIEYPNEKGQIRSWQNWFSPIIDNDEVLGITVFSSDVTERIELTEG